MKLIKLLQNQFITYFKNQSDLTHLFSAWSIEIEIYTFLMTTNQYWWNTNKHLRLKNNDEFFFGKHEMERTDSSFGEKKWYFARQQIFVVLLSANIIPPIFIFIFIVRHHLMRERPEKISQWKDLLLLSFTRSNSTWSKSRSNSIWSKSRSNSTWSKRELTVRWSKCVCWSLDWKLTLKQPSLTEPMTEPFHSFSILSSPNIFWHGGAGG